MRTFEEFRALPKEELTRILRIGMEFDFQDAYIKTKVEFVELRSDVHKKPNGRYAYGPYGETSETLHIDAEFNATRLVSSKDDNLPDKYQMTVRNQVALFKELHRLDFI